MRTGAGQADFMRTVYVRGAEGGGRAYGNAAASLKTGMAASHGDSGSGFVAEEGNLPHSCPGRAFYTYLFQGTWPLPSAGFLVDVCTTLHK